MEYIKYIDLGENKMNRRDEKGSVLVLVLIGVLVISILGISGLTKSTTEISVSRNFNDDKIALFTANSGINYGINELRNTIDPQSV
jgi:Tfp pilus assembly protein PilX